MSSEQAPTRRIELHDVMQMVQQRKPSLKPGEVPAQQDFTDAELDKLCPERHDPGTWTDAQRWAARRAGPREHTVGFTVPHVMEAPCGMTLLNLAFDLDDLDADAIGERPAVLRLMVGGRLMWEAEIGIFALTNPMVTFKHPIQVDAGQEIAFGLVAPVFTDATRSRCNVEQLEGVAEGSIMCFLRYLSFPWATDPREA